MEVPIMVEGEVGMAVALLVLGKVGHECYLCALGAEMTVVLGVSDKGKY